MQIKCLLQSQFSSGHLLSCSDITYLKQLLLHPRGPEAESNGTSAIVTKLHSPTQHQVQSSLEKSSVGQR